MPTPEWKRPALASVYALGKYVQERLTLTLAPAYGMEGVALRLWNVYGPGQALSNPYTGVLAIFSSRLHNGKPPVIFEDGQQRRDFVHVEDVADAFVLALEHPKAAGEVYQHRPAARTARCSEVAALLANAMGRPDLGPEIAGKARAGDIRHCIADIAKSPRGARLRAAAGFRARARRARRMGRPAGGRGPRRRGPQGARAARARGMTATSAPARPALVGRRPVLVTGGAGFIGSNLADRLAREGHDVLVFDALARPGVEGNLAWLKSRHPQRIIERRSATSATSAASPPRRGTPRRCSTSRRRSR